MDQIRRMLATLLALALALSAVPGRGDEDVPPPDEEVAGRTPPRLSFIDGNVSFWRPGAGDWVAAQINTPLAPGDALYAAEAANLELQIDARAFVRAGALTQLGFENQEPNFLQFKVTTGHLSLDLRGLAAGDSLEVDTPNAVFSIDHAGYYRADVDEDTTAFITRRGGYATMTPAGGASLSIAASEQVVVTGTDAPKVETYVAPEVDRWDRWNYERTDHLIDAMSGRYVPQGIYGADALDHYGSWRVVGTYGPVWVPDGVSPTWAPYSTGRWIWDPSYGWTWLDEAPWGWAPYHYGRWVYVDDYWAWAPGPMVVAPVYAPALVAFFGGGFGVDVGIGVPPFGWVALGWGEPCIPWWGPPHFHHRPWWGGWGGPRVVNNVVISRTTVVGVNDISVYRNVDVHHAVVVVRGDRFGRDRVESMRLTDIDVRHLTPVHGELSVKPVAASVAPGSGRGIRPPERVLQRRVVSTRPPHDPTAELRPLGLNTGRAFNAPEPRLVPPLHQPAAFGGTRPPFGESGSPERARPPAPPRFEERALHEGSGRGGAEPRARHPESPRGPLPQPAPPQIQPPRGEPKHGEPQPVEPPGAMPRVERPEAPTRPLPGEPANRMYPGRGEERPPQSEAPQRVPSAPHAPAVHGGGGGSGRSQQRR